MVLVCTPLLAEGQPLTNHVDTGSIAAFADDFLPVEMAKRHIPGAVFVLVAEGQPAVVRGFGFADLESKRPVEPDRTIFRVASVSKVVTATAALQLVEQGRLDLTKDVNAYLRSFRLAPFRGPPVTLHHLLTHTAGFDERLIGVACRQPTERQPLAAYLASSMPPRFTEPGQAISYSNHGMALAGLLVEEVSGLPFHDYVRAAILEPLGMHRSGFLLTGEAAKSLATAYDFVDGQHQPLSRDCVNTSPSGEFAATGTDMSRFLIAHLQSGTYEGARILRESTLARMHARQFAPHPGISGWAYGFWEDRRNGSRGLMHDGGGKGYRALVYLLPDQNVGFFLAYNLADQHPDGELLEAFRQRFLSTYFPAPGEQVERGAVVQQAGTQFAGDYHYLRRARTTMETMISMVNQRVHIDQTLSGSVTMTGLTDKPVTLTAIGPMLFRRSDGGGLVAFDAVEANRPLRLILDGGGVRTFDRVSGFATVRVQVAWLLSMALAFAYAGLGRPVVAVVRSMRHRDAHPSPRGASFGFNGWDPIRWSIWLAGVASGLNIVFLVAFPVVFFGDMAGGVPAFVYGVPNVARVLLLIPPATSVLAVATLVAAFYMWQDGRPRLLVRLGHTLVAVALLSFVVFTLYWHLMGVQV
jgi:CubicO group peptidase (beta-lactamase class C family)